MRYTKFKIISFIGGVATALVLIAIVAALMNLFTKKAVTKDAAVPYKASQSQPPTGTQHSAPPIRLKTTP